MRWLRHSTATQEVVIGPFVDDTDYVTAETGLTIANTDIKLVKADTTTQANKNSGGATHLANGMYHLTLDATDTATVGILDLSVKVAGALLVRESFMVMSGAGYDAVVGDTGAGLVADVWNYKGSSADIATATALATVDTEVGVIDGIVDSILVDTAEIGAAGAGLTAVADQVWSTTSAAVAAVPALGTDDMQAVIEWLVATAGHLHKQTQTSTTYTARNAADSGNLGTANVVDDGTTATFGAVS